MALSKPCPRCQHPLDIPLPVPERIQCEKCGAVIKNKSSAVKEPEADKATPQAMAAPTPALKDSRPGTFILFGILACVLLICVVPVAGLGLAWFFSSGEKIADEADPARKLVAEEEAKKANEPPPMPPHIRAAVDKGVAHLKNRLQEGVGPRIMDGRFPDSPTGATALLGLALLEAKVPYNDPAIVKVLATVREHGPKLTNIYSLGTVLFFLNRLHDEAPLNTADRELLRTLALRVIAGQLEDGRWTYGNNPINAQVESDLLRKLADNRYKPSAAKSQPPSQSMTQFALLALWGSRRHGIPARPAILASAARFHQTQHADGTWDYNPEHVLGKMLHDSNTCAGLIALAMEKTLREDQAFQGAGAADLPADAKTDERCNKAFAHLAKVIGRAKEHSTASNDPKLQIHFGTVLRADAWGDYYFLWCLERVAVIYDVQTIGGKDWYRWGSDVILKNQQQNGSWVDKHGDVPDTCFAILFLTRANLAKDLTESIRTRGGRK